MFRRWDPGISPQRHVILIPPTIWWRLLYNINDGLKRFSDQMYVWLCPKHDRFNFFTLRKDLCVLRPRKHCQALLIDQAVWQKYLTANKGKLYLLASWAAVQTRWSVEHRFYARTWNRFDVGLSCDWRHNMAATTARTPNSWMHVI